MVSTLTLTTITNYAEISLSQPHLSHVQNSFRTIGLDSALLFENDPAAATLKLRRILSIAAPSQKGGKARLRSVCEINGKPVAIKDLTTVASPLIAIVDASAAAMALAKPNARIAVIDMGVPASVLVEARRTQKEYRECREQREKLQNELANRALPPSIVEDDEQDLILLQHWVAELDIFRDKMVAFCDSVGELPVSHDSFGNAISALASVTWPDNAGTDIFSSLMYINMLEFRDALKSLDLQVTSARLAFEVLGSLSSSETAMTALSLARNHLFDATANEDPDGRFSRSAEITHETINTIEETLSDCLKSLEDERKGLLGMLESIRERVMMTVDDVDVIIADWNTLARKHGMSPYTLPACHQALQSELYGNVEARLLLPKALAREGAAQNAFEIACVALSKERNKVGGLLSASVTKRMPSLGLEGSKFEVQTRSDSFRCVDPTCFAASSVVGTDLVDFLLIHEVESDADNLEPRGGNIDVVASSGEKARLLLAIECELPGSIGASCNIAREKEYVSMENNYPPVAVLYDEIDAHVGGRAAVAMGSMLADQSRNGRHSKARGQIISITHSPSLAAIADVHLVIQKQSKINGEQSVSVTATMVEGMARRKELARMASGDLAPDEAEVFAEALLRDGVKRRIGS